jgi:Histidine-specific methyltransferase, SAM-dependent
VRRSAYLRSGHSMDNILTQEMRETYLLALSRGTVPLKLAYLVKPAEAQRLMDLPGYQANTWSLLDEAKLVSEAVSKDGVPGLCYLGVGGGVHLVKLIAECQRRGTRITRCMGVDVVPDYLVSTARRIRDEIPKLEFTPYEWDFEEGSTEAVKKWRNIPASPAPLVLTLLGLTLGNVESPARVLRNIRESCETSDALITVVAVARGTRMEMLAPYTSKAFAEATLAPVAALGLPRDSLRTRVWWDGDSIVSEVEVSRRIEIANSGKVLLPGETFRVFRSRRFSVRSFASLVRSAGWRIRLRPSVDAAGHLIARLDAV